MTEQKTLSRSEREAQIKDKAGWVIVVMAALLAINTYMGNGNSGRILNDTIEANNTWAFYQAKSIKGTLAEMALDDAMARKDVNKKKKKELLLMVCSNGGDMGAAFALIDVMMSSQIPVKTVGLGTIASAGLLIFISGSHGRRVLTPNTSILSHQFSWYNEGKAHELFATMREFELTQARMIAHYELCTGLGREEIRTNLLPPQDIWLSAQEAMALGICDDISVVKS